MRKEIRASPSPIASILVLEPLSFPPIPSPLLSGIYDLVPFLDRFGINVECKGSTDTERALEREEERVPHIFSPDFNVGKRVPLSRETPLSRKPSLSSFAFVNLGSLQGEMKDSGTYNFTIRDKRMVRMVRILKLDLSFSFFLSFFL